MTLQNRLVTPEKMPQIAFAIWMPLTLPRFDMGDGNATSHALFAEGTDLRGLMQIYGQIGNHHTAPTAVLRWTEVGEVMDALEFIRERNRMCKSFGVECENCPANKDSCCDILAWKEELVTIVEKWSKENPRKTRQSVFLEQYPETILDSYGVLQFCPTSISAAHRDSNGACKDPERLCKDCRREFWMQEIE